MPRYTQVERMFREDVMPAVRAEYETDGIPDYPARCEAWNNFTDALCKEGSITSHQYETWNPPACCLTADERRAIRESRKRARDRERAEQRSGPDFT